MFLRSLQLANQKVHIIQCGESHFIHHMERIGRNVIFKLSFSAKPCSTNSYNSYIF